MIYLTYGPPRNAVLEPFLHEISANNEPPFPGGRAAIIADSERGGEANAEPAAADGDPTEAPTHAKARGGRDGLRNSQHTQEACQGSEIELCRYRNTDSENFSLTILRWQFVRGESDFTLLTYVSDIVLKDFVERARVRVWTRHATFQNDI